MNNQLFYNASIEQAILSAIIFEPEIFQEVFENLEVEDFYIPFHQNIFKAMEILDNEDKPIDEQFLKIKLEQNNQFNEFEMLELLTANPISNFSSYFDEIREMRRKRELKKLSLKIEPTFIKAITLK